MKSVRIRISSPDALPAMAALLSVIFWISDAIVDVVVFGEQGSIIENVVSPEPVEFWMRVLVVSLFIAFSFYARRLLKSQINASNELSAYKKNLEKIVDDRTNELRIKNTELIHEIKIRKEIESRLEALASTDPLTQLYNRRKFDEILSYEISRDLRYRTGLSLIMCDIDHFKQINDRYGHEVGDTVLKQFSQKIAGSIRRSDLFARWGGEEFALLITNTDGTLAGPIAQKIRKMIETVVFDVVGRVTASFGVAILTGQDDAASFVRRADGALYQAKEAGRNCVVIADE